MSATEFGVRFKAAETKTVKLARLSVCECGYSALDESIPIGTEYSVIPETATPVTMICGGCGKHNKLTGVYTLNRKNSHGGYLPRELFCE